MSNFCLKNQFWHNFTFRHILAPKLEGILEHFILKSIKLLNFHAKNQDFDPKSDLKNVEKKLISTNFWTKTTKLLNFFAILDSKYSVKLYSNTKFKVFLKLNFWTKNGGLEQCAWMNEKHCNVIDSPPIKKGNSS